MAINPNYSHSETLAKVKIGASIYWMKDADLRSIVEAFGTATAKDSTDTVTSNGVALPTESAIYDFVLSQIGTLGAVLNLLSVSDHTAVDSPKAGDTVVEADGKEWLYDGAGWREVGDENIYALKTTSVAGLTLESNITSAALSSALGLEALAFKASASGTLTNYVTGIEGATYTPAGEVTVALNQTSTAASLSKSDYTPAGNVSVVLSETSTAATITSASYTPAGTVTVTPNTADFNEVASVGKLASLTSGTGNFATAGVLAAIDSSDQEMLVFTNASTAAAVNALTFDAGELPSLKSEATHIVTGISSASFAGTEVSDMRITGVTYDKATLSSASFTGTKAEGALVTAVSYDKATVSNASFSGTSSTIAPTLTSATKNVSVS